MTKEIDFHVIDWGDIAKGDNLVIFLLVAIGIFILIQIMNGILNILTARDFKKKVALESQIRAEESTYFAAQWENVLLNQTQIIKRLDILDTNLHALQDDVFDVIVGNAKEEKPKKRGPYKSRKPKVLEHKVKKEE